MEIEKMQNQEVKNQVIALRRQFGDLLQSSEGWDEFALDLFRFQATYNDPYARFVSLRGVNPSNVGSINDIPFLPVEVFQRHRVSVFTESLQGEQVFLSSGTTSESQSHHYLDDPAWYRMLALEGFKRCYGSYEDVAFLGLLPGYIERGHSSLVHMVKDFMSASPHSNADTDFFLRDWDRLERRLDGLNRMDVPPKKVIIVGVTHALLDWAETGVRASRWKNLTIEIVETGGMKGTRKEWIRREVHRMLSTLSTTGLVGSEYGMTEMLSQAWSREKGLFQMPPWLQFRLGSLTDPGEWQPAGRQGRIHVMDLGNITSCSFLATGDIGRLNERQQLEVLGRFDHAQIRGCNLMVFE